MQLKACRWAHALSDEDDKLTLLELASQAELDRREQERSTQKESSREE